ncbi:hypothetical protein [Amycolatopsis sp. 195334CR]|uniref:hypothetical protein n=1 Tax=Amycolatopsis sp. 195334CR TaxID=2814588 RepID=UPI001A8E90E7|nr:hypothetical protein [Amycolatopsis sp. 195334CR]MBN6035233.1 hypothetical protein [Amycolatopsis sp. 195334CR]
MSVSELHERLTAVRAAAETAVAHLDRAGELLAEARRAIVDPQAQADPWVPPQLAQAVDQLDTHKARIAGADEALGTYLAML